MVRPIKVVMRADTAAEMYLGVTTVARLASVEARG
jgi:hypothetical protein